MSAKKYILLLAVSVMLSACQSTSKSDRSPATKNDSKSSSDHSSSPAVGSDEKEYVVVRGGTRKPDGWQKVKPTQRTIAQNNVELVRFQYSNRYLDMLNLSSNILFDFDRSTLRPSAQKVIDQVFVDYLKDIDKQYIYIVGHTDSDGDAQYNIGLSLERATAVVKSLKRHGLDTDKVFVVPAGEHMPLLANDSQANKAKNRRVEIYVSPWRDMAKQFIRDWVCPVNDCDYARVSLLPVNRNFELQSGERGSEFAEQIMPMETSFRRDAEEFEAQVRNVPSFPVEVRTSRLSVEVRPIPRLGEEYRVDSSSPRLKKLIEQLEKME